MNIFLSYVLLGLSLAAPIGPINAAQLDKGIRYGFLHAWLVGLGSMFADIVFMLLIYFGSAHFLQTPFMKTFLWLFGGFVLIYTGVESFRKAGEIKASRGTSDEPPSKSFLQGFFLTFSNPISILFWLGIYGSVLATASAKYGTGQLLLYSSGIILGLLIWDVAMALAAGTFKKIGGGGVLTIISRTAGVALIAFGLYFASQAFMMLFL